MSRSLGTASSNPGEGTPYDPHEEAVRDGEAAPSDWPEKGEMVRISGANSSGQRFADFEGAVVGVEFRTTPPILEVVSDGVRHDVDNIGNGAEWSRA